MPHLRAILPKHVLMLGAGHLEGIPDLDPYLTSSASELGGNTHIHRFHGTPSHQSKNGGLFLPPPSEIGDRGSEMPSDHAGLWEKPRRQQGGKGGMVPRQAKDRGNWMSSPGDAEKGFF